MKIIKDLKKMLSKLRDDMPVLINGVFIDHQPIFLKIAQSTTWQCNKCYFNGKEKQCHEYGKKYDCVLNKIHFEEVK